MMSWICFIWGFLLSNYFYVIVYCVLYDDMSLIVTENNGQFQLTLPYKYEFEKDDIISYFKTPKKGKTYNFCPDTFKSVENALYRKETLTPNSEINDAKQCSSEVHPVFGEVKNLEKVKNMGTNSEEIQLYHSGFLLYTKDLDSTNIQRKKEEKNNPTVTKVEYLNNWGADTELFVQIEVFYNPSLKRTAAVQYRLLSTTLPYYEKMFVVESSLLSFRVKKLPKLFAFYASDNYMAEFTKKIHADWIEKIGNDFSVLSIKLSQFASIYHFQIPIWEKATEFMLNIVPLWTKTINKWHVVEKFAPIVANNLGDLDVSAGVTGVMTLSGEEVVDPRGFKMPKYLWKAFEYSDKNEVYGILVILHCNPFEKTETKICEQVTNCEQIGWPVSNADFHTGEIYCCEMNEENIKNLNADYLSLKKREVFNLNNWMQKKYNILSDFIDVLNEFIKFITDK